jgi:hypothetical protein
VTSNYVGALAGDPDGGATRVITQNNGGPTYWVGKQQNGGNFTPYWDKTGAVGLYDHGGALSMARTLGGNANQVAVPGRKVLLGWLGYGGGKDTAMQSLGRDLSLSKDYELLQQFVPELKMLRIPGSYTRSEFDGDQKDGRPVHQSLKVAGSPLAEVVATFELSSAFLAERSVAPCPPVLCPAHPSRMYCSSDPASGQCDRPPSKEPCPPCSTPGGSGSFGVTVLGGGVTGEYPPRD